MAGTRSPSPQRRESRFHRVLEVSKQKNKRGPIARGYNVFNADHVQLPSAGDARPQAIDREVNVGAAALAERRSLVVRRRNCDSSRKLLFRLAEERWINTTASQSSRL